MIQLKIRKSLYTKIQGMNLDIQKAQRSQSFSVVTKLKNTQNVKIGQPQNKHNY